MLLTILLIVVMGLWAALLNGEKRCVIRVVLILVFAVLLAAHIWVTTAEHGIIGSPLGLNTSSYYKVANITQLDASNTVVLFVDAKGNVSSCGFSTPITVPSGTLCRVVRQTDGSYALLPH